MSAPSTTPTTTSKLEAFSIQEKGKQANQLKKQTTDWHIVVLAKKIFYAIQASYHSVREKIYKAYDFIYAKNRVTGVREFWLIPTWLEKRIGENSYPYVIDNSNGESIRPEVNKLISNIKDKLIPFVRMDCPDFEYEIKAVRSTLLNSQYTLGGKVAVNEGLIDQIAHEKDAFGLGNLNLTLEDKIAAVVSRRLVNTCAGHFYPNNMDHILDADHYGIHYLNKAGYNPAAGIWLLQYFLKISTPKLHKSPNYFEKLLRSYYDPTLSLKLRLEILKSSYIKLMESEGKKVTFPKDFGVSNVEISEIGKEGKESKNAKETKESNDKTLEEKLNFKRRLEKIYRFFQIFLKIPK